MRLTVSSVAHCGICRAGPGHPGVDDAFLKGWTDPLPLLENDLDFYCHDHHGTGRSGDSHMTNFRHFRLSARRLFGFQSLDSIKVPIPH